MTDKELAAECYDMQEVVCDFLAEVDEIRETVDSVHGQLTRDKLIAAHLTLTNITIALRKGGDA